MAELSASGSVTLANVGGTVTGSVTLGPGLGSDRGSARWHVTGVIVKTTRPGVAPIPNVQVLDQIGIAQGVSYDGSFDQGPCDIPLQRGGFLTITWTGGQVGDVATAILSGTKS